MGGRRSKGKKSLARRLKEYKDAKQRRSVSGPFICPRCGKKTLTIKKGSKRPDGTIKITARCPACGVNGSVFMKYSPIFKAVDYYNFYVDLVSRGEKVAL
jgi:transcription elongation factor Elf1